jgi:hypothetical protein
MTSSVCTSYPLELSPSTIAPLHQFQPDIHSFLIGTNSLIEKNKIYQVDFFETTNHISEKCVYIHPNEIFSLVTNPNHSDKIITVSRPVYASDAQYGKHVGTYWHLPNPSDHDDPFAIPLEELGTFSDISSTFPTPQTYTSLQPNGKDKGLTGKVDGVNSVVLPNYTNVFNPLQSITQWGSYLSNQLSLNQPYPTPYIPLSTISSQPDLFKPLQKIIWDASTNTSVNSTSNTHNAPNAKLAALDPTIAIDTNTLVNAQQSNAQTGGGGKQTVNYCLAQYHHGVGLYDLNIIENGNIKHLASTRQVFNSEIQNVCWNKQKVGEHFYISTKHHIHGIDTRTMKDSFIIPYPHGDNVITNIDSNSIKPYTILTTGSDGVISVWDIRRPTTPILSTRLFTHAITCSEFNMFHDNLVFAGGLDGTVGLFSLASVASIPVTMGAGGSGGSHNNSNQFGNPGGHGGGQNTYSLFGNTTTGIGGRGASASIGGGGGSGGGGVIRDRTQLEAKFLFPHIEPPFNSYTNSQDGKQRKQQQQQQQQQDGMEQKVMTIQDGYEQEDYNPRDYSVANGNNIMNGIGGIGGGGGMGIGKSSFDSNGNGQVGDYLLSYHREHHTPVIDGCWSCSSPWHYATLSSDGTLIVNQVFPESEQYKLLL